MAYDNYGATVGAAGHDAATLVAALIPGSDSSIEEVLVDFFTIRDAILANSLELQATAAPAEAPKSRSYTPRSSGGGGATSGGPAGSATDIRSGKYTGRTVGDVIAEDLDYAEWAAANMKNDYLRKAFVAGLAEVG